MTRKSTDRTGVMIVRLWMEANRETGLRARITQTLDTATAERSVGVGGSADDICAVVKEWVEAFTESGTPDGNGELTAGSNGDGS